MTPLRAPIWIFYHLRNWTYIFLQYMNPLPLLFYLLLALRLSLFGILLTLILAVGILLFPCQILSTHLLIHNCTKANDPILSPPFWVPLWILFLHHLRPWTYLFLWFSNPISILSPLLPPLRPLIFVLHLIISLKLNLFLPHTHVCLTCIHICWFHNKIPLFLLHNFISLLIIYFLPATRLPPLSPFPYPYCTFIIEVNVLPVDLPFLGWVSLHFDFPLVSFILFALILFWLFLQYIFRSFHILTVYYPRGRRVEQNILISIMVQPLVAVSNSEILRIFHMVKITMYMVHAVGTQRLIHCTPTLPGNGQYIMTFPYRKFSPCVSSE